jgi:hypothetical protein
MRNPFQKKQILPLMLFIALGMALHDTPLLQAGPVIKPLRQTLSPAAQAANDIQFDDTSALLMANKPAGTTQSKSGKKLGLGLAFKFLNERANSLRSNDFFTAAFRFTDMESVQLVARFRLKDHLHSYQLGAIYRKKFLPFAKDWNLDWGAGFILGFLNNQHYPLHTNLQLFPLLGVSYNLVESNVLEWFLSAGPSINVNFSSPRDSSSEITPLNGVMFSGIQVWLQ